MDSARFDTLARALTTPGSRRRALTQILGGALGLRSALALEEAAAKGSCPPCKRRNKAGRCRKNQPDGTICGIGYYCCAGVCHSGSCSCRAVGVTCSGGTECCSGKCGCLGSTCTCRAQTCHVT